MNILMYFKGYQSFKSTTPFIKLSNKTINEFLGKRNEWIEKAQHDNNPLIHLSKKISGKLNRGPNPSTVLSKIVELIEKRANTKEDRAKYNIIITKIIKNLSSIENPTMQEKKLLESAIALNICLYIQNHKIFSFISVYSKHSCHNEKFEDLLSKLNISQDKKSKILKDYYKVVDKDTYEELCKKDQKKTSISVGFDNKKQIDIFHRVRCGYSR